MITTILTEQLNTLPMDSLAILKDNLGTSDIFSLCLKMNQLENLSFDFKISFTVVDTTPVCILMIKNRDKIYKCLIRLDIMKEFNDLKNLMSQKNINLFIFEDQNKKSIIKIDNQKNKKFIDAITNLNHTFTEFNNYSIDKIKQKLLNSYSDYELWNLNNI